MRKKGFTMVEILITSSIMGLIMFLSFSLMWLMTTTLYDGETERHNRSNMTDNIYYITREIQSAEAIKVSADLKTLKIKQRGSSDYSLVYSVVNGIPTGGFYFKSKKMLDLDYAQSKFEIDEKTVVITLAVYKNNLDFNAKPQIMKLEVVPRSNEVSMEAE